MASVLLVSRDPEANRSLLSAENGRAGGATAARGGQRGDSAAQNAHGDAWGALTRTQAAVAQRLQDALAQAERLRETLEVVRASACGQS